MKALIYDGPETLGYRDFDTPVAGEGEDLVEQPFQRLIEQRQLVAYPYEGFWACMDTYKDKKAFDAMEARGDMSWQVWNG